jgi:putative phosphoribosyl transferase
MKGRGVTLVTRKNKEKLHNRAGGNLINKHPTVFDLAELRDRVHVFRDRAHAGKVLASMLDSYGHSNTIVLGIPAGGLPVAAVIAEHLHLLFDILVVSKITLPWNSEVGYGAVAFDGTVRLNEQLLPRLGLNKEEIRQEIKKTFGKVTHRVRSLRGERAFPDLSKQSVILVDDGLASGFTLIVGVEALRKAGARQIIVAVPTGHWDSVQLMAHQVEAVYCANIRQGWSFAVADAYERWSDVSDEEMVEMIKRVKQD